jgi:protein tyrosine/serine phosphatase
MVNKLDEMEGKLNEQIDRNVVLNKRLAESTSDGILGEVSEGLAVTQKEKLATLAESVEFDSETDYREKLVTLREAYFPSRPASAQRDSSEYIAEEASMTQQVSGSMEGYLTALQRVSKK